MLRMLKERVRAVMRHEADQALKPLRRDLQRLAEQRDRQAAALEELKQRAADELRAASQLKSISMLDAEQRELVATLPQVLDEGRILAHVRRAIASAEIRHDPCDYIVVDRLLPDDVYELLITAIPPAPFFDDRDPIKRNVVFPITFAPQLTMRVWNFMDGVVAGKGIAPAAVEKFHDALQDHYDTIFGPESRERANQLPRRGSGGRLMLRRPGYHLAPHRDPKRSLITCLMYLARPGDSETYGTQIFRVIGDHEASYKQTYFPEEEGRRCEVVKTVPFRANSMLIFLNSRGAHGATIPAEAPPELERYTYQFYVTPKAEALTAFVKTLTPERRARWVNKSQVAAP